MYHLYQNDIPADLLHHPADALAIDTETTGLNIGRDRLCVVQLSFGDGVAHLVQFAGKNNGYDCPNLKALLQNPKIVKIFHFGRFDIASIEYFLNIRLENIFCTKIASKLVRTFTNKHGLKDLVKDYLEVELSKQQQTSDWGNITLTPEQCTYAASDVLYLHGLREHLTAKLAREDRLELAAECFRFLPTRARLDLLQWDLEKDFFAHS
jgi:ribonuclease D